jgi:hypothetical protein
MTLTSGGDAAFVNLDCRILCLQIQTLNLADLPVETSCRTVFSLSLMLIQNKLEYLHQSPKVSLNLVRPVQLNVIKQILR